MIRLTHNYIIDVTSNCYVLCVDKQRVDKKGREIYETIGYYSTINAAITAAKEHCIKKYLIQETFTLNGVIEIIKQINKEFSDLLKEVLKSD